MFHLVSHYIKALPFAQLHCINLKRTAINVGKALNSVHKPIPKEAQLLESDQHYRALMSASLNLRTSQLFQVSQSIE